jgi:hypothetical protein
MRAMHEYVNIHAYVYGIMHLWINLCMYRLVQNFPTHSTKSVHLNGRKDFNMLLTYRKRLSPNLIVSEAGAYFAIGHQGSRLSKNGGDRSREVF